MFQTTIVGSLPKPAWLAETQKLSPQWHAQGAELQQAKRDATLLWIKLEALANGAAVARQRYGTTRAAP